MRLLIILLGVLAYLTSFGGVLLFDDDAAITNNPYVRTLWPLSDSIKAPPQSSVAGRPVVSLSLALNYAFGELRPWGYHAFNLTVHLLAGLTLFGVLRHTLSGPRLRRQYGGLATPLAGAIALIWVVHPLQTESVTYIVQRAESLVGLFYLLTLYCAIRGFEAARPRLWFIAAALISAVGMATKEVMATAPLAVLLYDRIFVADTFRQIAARRRDLYAGLAATWLVLGLLVIVGPRSETAGFGLPYLAPWEYARSQFGVILHYLRLCFWPHPLCLDYAWPVAQRAGEIVPQALVVAALLAGTIWALWRRSPVGFLGAWFFLTLAPTSSIVPIRDLAFEHRMYLPLAAVVTLTVMAGWWAINAVAARLAWRDSVRRALAVICVAALVVPLGIATSRRGFAYRSTEIMWGDVLATRPGNARAHCGLAYTLAAQGRLQEAIEHYGISLRMNPGDPITHNNYGGVLANMGLYDEAARHFAAAVSLYPKFTIAQVSLGNALHMEGDIAGAVAAHRKAIEMDGSYGDAYYNLGMDYAAEGKLDDAVAAFQKCLILSPAHKSAKEALAKATSRPAES
ncbi:MAG TPA: tetratricopeptide repeat protein [Phycisphaerae bacterium]|nr:tetratricopeptide repeat protein [Phycisphaerae bacterium]